MTRLLTMLRRCRSCNRKIGEDIQLCPHCGDVA